MIASEGKLNEGARNICFSVVRNILEDAGIDDHFVIVFLTNKNMVASRGTLAPELQNELFAQLAQQGEDDDWEADVIPESKLKGN